MEISGVQITNIHTIHASGSVQNLVHWLLLSLVTETCDTWYFYTCRQEENSQMALITRIEKEDEYKNDMKLITLMDTRASYIV